MSRPIHILSSSVLALVLSLIGLGRGVAQAQPDDDDTAGEVPADEVPADEAPADEAPADDVRFDEAPATAQLSPDSGSTAETIAIRPPLLAISGFINTTYNYNVGRPQSGVNRFFSYNAQHNSLLLNAAHLALTGNPSEALAWTVELDIGADAKINTYANINGVDGMGNPVVSPEYIDVQEAYGVYTSGKLGIKVGKFATYEGIEVIESPANPTVSRGLLYGLAEPVYHTGAVLIYQVSPKADVHVGVVQGWDVLYDTNRGKMAVVKIGLTPTDTFALTLSGYVGPDLAGNDDDVRVSVDATGVFKPSPKVDVWFQGNFGNEAAGAGAKWFGAGLQPVFHLSDKLGLGARVEFFKDEGARTGAERQLINISAAPSYTIGAGFVVRAELRVDISNEEDFDDSDGETKKNQIVGLADATYSF